MSRQPPWQDPRIERYDVMAMKAVATGTANEGQQKHVLRFIIEVIAGTYGETYWPDSERHSTFAQGRRYCGLQIVNMCNLTATDLDRLDEIRLREKAAIEAARRRGGA